ncbi:MAG: AAA family ATPase, partial [Bacteroidia bacterium]|nr:AAA family ATPase [Bacteroidia bacterium]
MIKLPYGTSHFSSLIRGGYYYVDRTGYIPLLESLGERYLIFLRPRRFGKSLWLSTLAHYYGREHAEAFGVLFGHLAVGRAVTPLANSYLTLQFDFSGIDTQTRETTYAGFMEKIRQGILRFIDRYPGLGGDAELTRLMAIDTPAVLMSQFITLVARQPYKLYLLIDEYDHFTNELISFDLDHFQEIVSRQGWVRKFYEVIKSGTGQGTVDRIFMTGVSPVTLDSLTSGFNIG